MHAVRLQQAADLAAESKERGHVRVLPNDVNIEVTPRHQPEGVASDDMHFTVPGEDHLQARSQDLVSFGSDLVADHVGWALALDAQRPPQRPQASSEVPHVQISLVVVRSAIVTASAIRFQLAVSSFSRARPLRVNR